MKLVALLASTLAITALIATSAQAIDPEKSSVLTVQKRYSESQRSISPDEKDTKPDFSATVVLALKDDVRVLSVTNPNWTLGDVLEESNVDAATYRTEDGKEVDLNLQFKDRDSVFLFGVEYESAIEKVKIPFTVERLTSSSIPKGEVEVLVKGRDGLALTTTTKELDLSADGTVNENPSSNPKAKVVETTVIINAPRTEKILVGTGEQAIGALKPLEPSDNDSIPNIPFWPAEGRVSSEYGSRFHPIRKIVKLHDGIDIASPCGSDVLAAYPGVVIKASSAGGYGNRVEVDHGNGLVTSYSHLSEFRVEVDDRVSAKTIVGLVGSTGYSTGCHLHFMIEVNKSPKDPRSYLPKL